MKYNVLTLVVHFLVIISIRFDRACTKTYHLFPDVSEVLRKLDELMMRKVEFSILTGSLTRRNLLLKAHIMRVSESLMASLMSDVCASSLNIKSARFSSSKSRNGVCSS